MKDKGRDGRLREGRKASEVGGEGVDILYTRGRSQDLRDVTAKIRAIELFNPDGLLSPPSPL